jgi:hypothetical protein
MCRLVDWLGVGLVFDWMGFEEGEEVLGGLDSFKTFKIALNRYKKTA